LGHFEQQDIRAPGRGGGLGGATQLLTGGTGVVGC